MKPIAFIIAAILYFAQAHAQTNTFSYEQADSLSSAISGFEKHIEGKAYKDAKGNSYTLSFPSENFKVYFHDKLASKAFYMASSDREILILTENIDFSKVTGMSISEDPNNVSYIQLHFPAGLLKAQFIENGIVIQTSNTDNLEFYCRYGTVDDTRKMVDLLYDLCLGLKVEKGILTAQQAKQQQEKWKEAVAKNTPAAYSDFLQKFPNTIVQKIAYHNSEKIDPTIKYITGNTNGFYLGMAKDEFTKTVRDKITKTKNSGQKLSKNFKRYLDNFEVQYYEKKPYSTYTIGNWFKTYYTDLESRNDARRANELRIHEFEIERKFPVWNHSMIDQIDKLNLSWNKAYKLRREIENYEYTIGQIKDTKIHQTFFPFAKYASLGDIVFENDIAKEITYTFVIYDDNMSYDASLQRIVELMGKPIREKTYTRELTTVGEGKVFYFDKGRYYVVASVRRDYNSEGWLYTPLQASLTFIVK